MLWKCCDALIYNQDACPSCGTPQEIAGRRPDRDELLEFLGLPVNGGISLFGEQPDRPGLYLGLFHGRKTPDENMDDWGFEGPLVGPLKYLQVTYMGTMRLHFENPKDAQLFGLDPASPFLFLTEDLIKIGEAYYGDWTAQYYNSEN